MRVANLEAVRETLASTTHKRGQYPPDCQIIVDRTFEIWLDKMALDTMRFTIGTTSGLAQARCFEGVPPGDLGELDTQMGDHLNDSGKLSHSSCYLDRFIQ